MKSDSDLKRDVEAELRWSADVDDTDIAINVQDFVVMLTGFVRSYFEKDRAAAAALRVKGADNAASRCGAAKDTSSVQVVSWTDLR